MTAPEIRPATELKPCPLCGEESAVGYSTGFKRVRCNSCFCGTEPSIEGPEKAISRWNTRPIEDSLRAEAQERDRKIAAQAEEIERLREVLGEILNVLRIHAPGTPLNNHAFDSLGVRARAALKPESKE